MMRLFPLLLGTFLMACSAGPVGNPRVPEPAKAVDLQRYQGTWYEMVRYENRFERGCEGVTAEYTLREDGRMRVLNTCRQGAVDGPMQQAEGTAKVVEGSGNAKLKVAFFGPFYVGDYWVLDRAEDYSWSIVGEPSGRYVWILTRDPVPPEAERQALIERVRALGYDTALLYEPQQLLGIEKSE